MHGVPQPAGPLSPPVDAPAARGDVLRVLIALVDPAARREIAAALQDAADLECVGEAESGAEAIAHVKVGRERPQLVVLDAAMPDIDAVAAARRITELRPEVRVVMLATNADEERGVLALRAGAVGYLNRDISLEVLLRVLRKVAEGEAAVPRTLTARLLERLREPPEAGPPPPPARLRVRVALGVFGVLAGLGGLAIATILPHSAAEASPGGSYVQSQYYVLLLLGSIEAILFGLLSVTLALFRPNSRWLPTTQAVTAVVGVVVAIGAALVLFDYQSEPDESANVTRPAAPLRR